jgi:hypothetical protein
MNVWRIWRRCEPVRGPLARKARTAPEQGLARGFRPAALPVDRDLKRNQDISAVREAANLQE